MANPIIKIKRGSNAPTTPLQAGEFAIDQAAKNLYLGVEVGGVVSNEIVGGEGTFATKAYVTTALGGVSGTLGSMAIQDKEAVNITGGSINNSAIDLFIHGAEMTNASLDNGSVDNTPIGATTPSTGAFTTLSATDLSGTINALTSTLQFANLTSPAVSGAVITGSDIDSSAIGATTASTGAFTTLTASNAPSASTDVVRKTDLDSAISALGSVFSYKGQLTSVFVPGNPLSFPLDLSTLSQDTGSYYSLNYDYSGSGNPNTGAVEVTWTEGGVPKTFLLKAGDAIVKTTLGWEKLDNVDAEVLPTANEIAVTGDENVGYTVSIDPVFSGRMTTAEGDITTLQGRATDLETKTQNIDLAGTSAGLTQINDKVIIQGIGAEFIVKTTDGTTDVINAKDANITIGGAKSGGQVVIQTEKFIVKDYTGSQVWEINEYGAASNKLTSQSNKSSFNLDMDGNVTLGADVANTSVKAQGTFIVSPAGAYAPSLTVESLYGSGAANALFNVDGNTHSVSLGGNWPATEVKVRSAKLVGVDGSFGTPALENFVIDGGVY